MTRIAKLVRASSHGSRSSLAEATMVGLSVAVVLFGAVAQPAGASTVSSTKDQLQGLQAEVVAGASRIATLTLAFNQANTQATSLAQQVATDQAEVANLLNQVSATSAILRSDAIFSYTGGDMAATSDPSSAEASAIGEEYLTVASGNLEDTADEYRTEEAQVTSARSQLVGEERAADTALAATAAARQNALDQAQTVQSEISSLQSQLSVLEAQQAAEAASAAAQQSAATAAADPPTQGLPVNNGLVTVVKTVVAPTSGANNSGGGNAGGVWLRLRECESGDNYQENSGNGYYGAYQFSQQTWTSLGYPGRPDLEPPAMQDQAAQELQQRSGWGQWPACSAALGLT